MEVVCQSSGWLDGSEADDEYRSTKPLKQANKQFESFKHVQALLNGPSSQKVLTDLMERRVFDYRNISRNFPGSE